MVKITNGIDIFEVTKGALGEIYSRQGYYPLPSTDDNKEGPGEIEECPRTEEEVFCSELLEKPISGWNKEEVKKFAEVKGIDLTGTKNANEAKSRIVAYLEA